MGGQLVYVRRLQRRIRVCLEIPCLMELREILAEMDNMPRDQGKLYLDAELLNPYSHSNPLHTCDPWGNEVRYA